MRTSTSKNISYLYVNGLATDRAIQLSDNIVLLPTRIECSAELFLGLGKSDIDISVISLFLPQVESQLRIHGVDVKDTAMRAWNAVWDALLLGAFTGCNVMCNLQSDLPAEKLKPDSNLVVTNYQLRGLSTQPLHRISETESDWIEKHFKSAQELLQDGRYRNAVHCLATYQWHSMPRVQLAIVWSGIEGIFGVDSEIVFRVSLYAARFLAPDDHAQQIEVFAKVKELYKLRSKAVHGGKMKGDAKAGVSESVELLRSLVARCASLGTLPDTGSLVP